MVKKRGKKAVIRHIKHSKKPATSKSTVGGFFRDFIGLNSSKSKQSAVKNKKSVLKSKKLSRKSSKKPVVKPAKKPIKIKPAIKQVTPQVKQIKLSKPIKLAKLKAKKPGREEHGEHLTETYLKTLIPGLDILLGKGIIAGTSNLVEGGPGSGKTIFCLSAAIHACQQGKKVLYMSFEEPEDRLREHMEKFGWHPEQYEKSGKLMIKRFNALDIARSVQALLSEAKKELLIDVQPVLIPKEFSPDIVVVDSLTSISSAFSGEESRFRIYMEQLFRYLENHNITSFLIRETANPTHIGSMFIERGEAVSFLSDGIIAMYNVIEGSGNRARALEVIKMRGTDIQRKIVECEIKNKQGFIVYPNRIIKGKFTLT